MIGYLIWVYKVGFPDGYISEYSKRMLLVFGYCKYGLIVAMLFTLYLGYASKSKNVACLLKSVFVLWLTILLLLGSFHIHAIYFLDSGQGG